MSNPRSPQQAFADLLHQKAAPRASRLSADSEPARETRRAIALSALQQKSMKERFAARLAAIAREKATEQSRTSRASRKPRNGGKQRDSRRAAF